MKISQNKSFFMGNTPFQKQDMTVQDRIAQKKQLYQKKAMRVVTTANNAEKQVDKSIDDIKEKIKRLQTENEEANAFLNDYKQKMAQAKEYYNIADDSQEQKDLELMQKAYDIEAHGAMELLTEEEQERLANMGEMTEYQKLSMDLYKEADYWKTQLEDNNQIISGEAGAIRSIQIERLKTHGMVDAETAKEKILAAASDEIYAMLVDDAKEKMDEKAEEVKEAAEAREEKKEEEEERIEAAKENKKDTEEYVEDVQETASELTKQVVDNDQIMEDVNDQIKKIMMEEKLIEEDIKGLTVNVTT